MDKFRTNPFQYLFYEDEQFIPMYKISGVIDVMNCAYFISNYGRVLTVLNDRFELLSKNYNNQGYVQYNLICDRGRQGFRACRLVMIFFAYFDGCENYEVNHKNGMHDDDRLCNLEWVTHKENIQHSIDNGFTTWDRSLSNIEVINLKQDLLNGVLSREEISKKYNTTMNIINDIASGRIYKDIDISSYEQTIYTDAKNIDPNIVLSIYDDILHGTSIEDIVQIYNVPYRVAACIKSAHPAYKHILQNRSSINISVPRKISDEEVLCIYNDMANGMSVKEVVLKYNISYGTVSNIRRCIDSFAFLKFKYNLVPLENHNSPIDEETAVEIFKDAGYMQVKDLEIKYNISKATIIAIKQCKGRFKFLIDKYGFVPYNLYSSGKY